ncbi:MAG: ATP-dependent Clp protease proteolytic subunit [Betaproteobacteria bacterium]|nr:ATP-dependent Clp protease proteolytic subunit [Betaproteobacteria bacterium]
MNDHQELTINWDRSILIDSVIDDDLVRRLTPSILKLRQNGIEPITVGIDSPGGSLASLDVLLALLTGPTQDGHRGKIITVATHRAYSSAANLLAFGTYSVALSHSEILYHDVRYGGMDDVTPEKARDAAKSLQEANDAFAMRLAKRIIKRLVWIYIDQLPDFVDIKKRFPTRHSSYIDIVSAYAPPINGFECIDLAGFATSLWRKLSSRNDTLINNVMHRLSQWIHLTKIAKNSPTYRQKGSRNPGMLDGARHLHKMFKGQPEHLEKIEEPLKLFLSLVIADISTEKSNDINLGAILDRATREYGILQSFNDPRHIRYASDLMAQHSHIFFSLDIASLPENECADLLTKAAPHARLLWNFCVLLCRELFEGEHVLTPKDAQLLGLIDEVTGGGHVQSRREWHIQKLADTNNETGPSDVDSE